MYKSHETLFMLLEDMPIDLRGSGHYEMVKAGFLIRMPHGGGVGYAWPEYDALVSEGRMQRIEDIRDCYCDSCTTEREKNPEPSWTLDKENA